MNQPEYGTAQLPVDQINRIAGHFFDNPETTLLMPTLTEVGFSGSAICVFTHKDTRQKYLLKQLPRQASLEQILWIQSLATFTRNKGYTLLPVAVQRHGVIGCVPKAAPKIAMHTDGTLWQCLEYIDGKSCATPDKYQAMLGAEALATFHKVASTFEPPSRPALCGWRRRTRQLSSMLAFQPDLPDADKVDNSLFTELRALFAQFAKLIHAPETIKIIRDTLKHEMTATHQPAIKDCWWNHLLFSNSHDRITGIIDIDAAGWDDPAVDLARLLGSWQLENQKWQGNLIDLWPEAFEKYRSVVEPGPNFSFRVQILHDTSIICGMDRWFRWIFTENRQFPDMKLVLRRITHMLHAAPAAIRRLADSQAPQ